LTPPGSVELVTATPVGFAPDAARLPPPDLTETPQITLEQWTVVSDGPQMMVSACFGGQAGSWLPEADEIALQKLSQITLSTAIRVGLDVRLKPIAEVREGPVRTQTLDGEGAHAKTLLGFEPSGAAHGCFALCVRSANHACPAAVDGSHLAGALAEPPAPSAAMRVLSWAVHHPAYAGATVLGLFVLGGIAAILTRRRVHSRF
jgi:hypothetical protein